MASRTSGTLSGGCEPEGVRRAGEGVEWLVGVRKCKGMDEHGRMSEVFVLEASMDAGTGAPCRELPLPLDFASWVRYGWLGVWPPATFERVEVDDGSLVIEFRDPWIPFERPVLPFRYDQESLWKATYRRRRGRWRLERVRHLDYEGDDRP